MNEFNTEVWVDGKLRQFWNSTARTYTEYGESGEVLNTRQYTPEENARLDAEIALAQAKSTRAAQRALIKAIITELVAEKDRVQLVIDKANASITGADTKDVARAAKRIADAAIDLAKFVQNIE